MIRSASSLLALSAEVASWVVVARGAGRDQLPSAVEVAAFIALHGLACLALAVLLTDRLPPAYRNPPGPTRLFLFTIGFFLPLVGPLGLLASIVAARLFPAKVEPPSPWVITDVPDLPFRPLRFRQRFYTEGHLISLLRHAPDPEQRQKAVMALRQVSDKVALPILSIALKDPADDVRLLAYAMLDGHERTIFVRIREQAAALEEAEREGAAPSSERVLALRRRLAEDHWELAYLGLASGAALAQTLDRARDHAAAVAASHKDDGGVHLLLGRILIKQGAWDEAERALAQAWTAGQPDFVILWQLAEIAFHRRNFDQVAQLVAAAVDPSTPGTHRRPPLSLVARYWA